VGGSRLYLPEVGSDEFNEIVEGRDDVIVSDLAVTEIISAMARRLRQGSLAREARVASSRPSSAGSTRGCTTVSSSHARTIAGLRICS
jgi:hypothetical protein